MRAVQDRPAARGPNLHVIGAISNEGIVKMSLRRCAFRSVDAKNWVDGQCLKLTSAGKNFPNLLIVCDNMPCHSQLAEIANINGATILRLGPYSSQLNPIENVWSKLKSDVKSKLRIPHVTGLGVGEQMLVYLESIVQESINDLTDQICVRACQHASTFHASVINLENLDVGV